MDYGVTPQGFVRKPLSAILSEIEYDQRANISPEFVAGVVSALNEIVAKQIDEGWAQLELIYSGGDPDTAEDRQLDMVAKLTMTLRRGATKSRVTLRCNLAKDTTLEAGTHFAAIAGKADVRWTPAADFTAPNGGLFDVAFVSENTGPIEGPTGLISIIATPVVGWNAVTNQGDAELGHDIDSNVTLRARREADLATAGTATVAAIRSDLSDPVQFPRIEDVMVFENDTDEGDADGRPPHSVECVIYDGVDGLTDNDAIAQAIYDAKASGVTAHGTTFGLAVVDEIGTKKVIHFSRTTRRAIYVALTITRQADYIGDEAVKEYVATACNARFREGDEVVQSVVQSLPLALAGVVDVATATIGFSASPTHEENLAIGVREIARFDTVRIIVSSSPA